MEDKIALAIMDLIFVFGSGCMWGTFAQPMEPVSEEYPLCRTQQLMLCVALVLTRQVIYKYKADKIVPEKMAMNVFEEHLVACNDVPRIISETIQLENYIFRKPRHQDEKIKLSPESTILQDDPINDLELGMNILEELG